MIESNFSRYKDNNDTDKYVINIFYLEKCKPMKKYKEILKKIKLDNVYLYSLDKNPIFIDMFGIKGSPSTLIYKRNKMINQFMGVPKDILLEELKENIEKEG